MINLIILALIILLISYIHFHWVTFGFKQIYRLDFCCECHKYKYCRIEGSRYGGFFFCKECWLKQNNGVKFK